MRAFFFLFAVLMMKGVLAQTHEVIDLRYSSLNKSLQPLEGPGMLYPRQLLTPDECDDARGELIHFPSLFNWNNSRLDTGYATYRLMVLLPDGSSDLALSLPQMYSSYRLWMNGEEIAQNGNVAKSKEEYRPQWFPQTVSFKTVSDTLSLVLQVANFDHAKGGISQPIFIGESSLMLSEKKMSDICKLIEAAALCLTGIFFLMIFVIHTPKQAVLWFAMLCTTWGIRRLFSDTYLFTSWFPDINWNIAIHIEYILLFLFLLSATFFLEKIFPGEVNRFIQYIFISGNLLFTVFTLCVQPLYFTYALNVYLIAAVLLVLYSLITVIRVWFEGSPGSGWMALSILIALNVLGYDIYVSIGLSSSPYNALFFCIGYIITFLLMAVFLCINLGIIKDNTSSAPAV